MKARRTVLLTAAGTATAANLIDALRRSERYDVRVVAVDPDPDAAGLHLADHAYSVLPSNHPDYPDAIAGICAREKVDVVFPLYSGEIEVFARERALYAAQGVHVNVPSPEVVATCVDKGRFAAWLAGEGIAAPRTFASAAEVTGFPVFVKPPGGSSSRDARRIDDRSELDRHLARHPGALIQEFIAWPEATVDCFVAKSGVLVGCVPRWRLKVKDGKSVVAETFDDAGVIAAVEGLLQKLGLTGPCNVQLFVGPGGETRIVEVNPRFAAGGLPLATRVGTNIPELVLREADGEILSGRIFVKPGVKMIRYLTEVFVGG